MIVNTARPMSPASCPQKWFVLVALLLAFPALVRSQTNYLLGDTDVALSGALRGDQTFPSVAFGLGGGFIVWQDNVSDPNGLGVSGRRLNADLNPAGDVFVVNETLGRDQQRPRIAMLPDQGAVVVFQSGKPGAQNVYTRFLAPSGGFTTGEILVNNTAYNATNRFRTNWVLIRNNRPRNQKYRIREVIKGRQEFNANPIAAVLADGSVVIAYSSSRVYATNTFGLSEQLRWNDRRSIFITNRTRVPVNIKYDFMQDIYLQRLSAAGQKLGAEFRANQFANFNQRDAALASLENGNFVVAWVSEQQRFQNSVDIYARIFNSLGNPLGNEFRVNTVDRPGGSPAVTAIAGGGFTICWAEKAAERANGQDIICRTFDSGGNPGGDAVGVNTFTYGDQFSPSIVKAGAQQIVVWTSMGQDGSWQGVFGRALNGSSPAGDEFRINISTPFNQMQGQIAADGNGRALITWSGYTTENGFDLFGRLYVAP